MPATVPPHPLILDPILRPKVWGGRRLEGLGKALAPGEMVGESWEVADLGATSPSGAGGAGARSTIAEGPLAGQTLHDAMGLWGSDLLGQARPSPEGGFPLLVKYLDAREHLSVQVHPSPAYAAAHPGAHLKTESWFVIDAEPGSVLFVGLQPGVTRDDLARAVAGGTVPALLRTRPAVPGECHTLPSGTVHALGGGVLVAEVQTPSDTTFRLYDWTREYDRPQRDLHIEQALECALFDAPPPPAAVRHERGRAVVSRTAGYTIEAFRAHCEAVSLADDGSAPVVVMLTRTMGASIASRAGRFEEVALQRGRTVLVPASIATDAVLRAGPETEALIARLPE